MFYFLFHFWNITTRKMGLVQLVRKFKVVSESHIVFKNWCTESRLIYNWKAKINFSQFICQIAQILVFAINKLLLTNRFLKTRWDSKTTLNFLTSCTSPIFLLSTIKKWWKKESDYFSDKLVNFFYENISMVLQISLLPVHQFLKTIWNSETTLNFLTSCTSPIFLEVIF